jgi:hypothetical protein
MGDVARRAEASMLVTGSIVVTADGSVQSYLLDHPEKLPSGVVALIAQTVPSWAFQPVVVDGKEVIAKASMALRVNARETAKDQYTVRVAGASFGMRDPAHVGYDAHVPPHYPYSAMREGVSGNVYLAIEVGPNGSVEDVAAEQVNLFVMGDARTMKRWRNELAAASVEAARKWTFHVPGAPVGDAPFIFRVPVRFCMNNALHGCKDGYGQWQGYIPGPREPIPWLSKAQLASGSVDATPDDGFRRLDQNGLHLKTPLVGS